MEAQLATRRRVTTTTSGGVDDVSTNNERLSVKVTPADSSESTTTSGARMLDLQIILRTETQVPDLVIRILEFLKQVKEASIISMEAQTHQGQVPTNWVTFRLKIEVRTYS